MDMISAGLEPWAVIVALAVAVVAGVVKGAIGFAMPMIMISAYGSFMPAQLALAALILPTLVTNSWQAMRQGWREAWDSTVKYWCMIAVILVFIVISAQFVMVIPQWVMLLLLGVPITFFAVSQLVGHMLRFRIRNRARAEVIAGVIGGLYGGISGVWGPPVLVLLLSLGAPKLEMVRVQGVVFLLGAVVLLMAHIRSGVFDAAAAGLSAVLILPAALGMWLGYFIQDRLDGEQFRRWTLILLALTGLNLVRRALIG